MNCPHFFVSYHADAINVTRTCVDCGTTASRPQCTAMTRFGKQCASWVEPDSTACKNHASSKHHDDVSNCINDLDTLDATPNIGVNEALRLLHRYNKGRHKQTVAAAVAQRRERSLRLPSRTDAR